MKTVLVQDADLGSAKAEKFQSGSVSVCMGRGHRSGWGRGLPQRAQRGVLEHMGESEYEYGVEIEIAMPLIDEMSAPDWDVRRPNQTSPLHLPPENSIGYRHMSSV